MGKKGKISLNGYRSNSPDRFNDYNIIPSNSIDMHNVDHDVLMIPMGGRGVGNPVLGKPGERYLFPNHEFVYEMPMPKDAIMRYQRIMRNGGNLPKAQMYNSQVGLTPLDEQFIYPSKFDPWDESPMQQRAKACHKGDCLEGANTYYNRYVASKFGLPDTWKTNDAYGIVSGDPNQPYGVSPDSWDLAALMQAKGAIQNFAAPLYNDPKYKKGRRTEKDAEKYWKSLSDEEKKNIYSQMALGTLVNYGDWGGVDASRLQGSNEAAGLYPSRHSARVVGFSEDGMPVVYDYGKIRRLDQSGLGHPITNITTPKEVAKYNYQYVKDWQAKNQKKLNYDPKEKLMLTKGSIRKGEDSFTPAETNFVQAINDNIQNLMQVSGASQEDVIKAGKVAFGILQAETKGGRGAPKALFKEALKTFTDPTGKVLGEPSRGLTRIKPEMQAGDETNKYSQYLKQLGLNPKKLDLWDPKQSALATMALVLSRKGSIEGVDDWYLRAQQHNTPSVGPKNTKLLKEAEKDYANNVIKNASRLYSTNTGYGLSETEKWMSKKKAEKSKKAAEQIWSERFKTKALPSESTYYKPNVQPLALTKGEYGMEIPIAENGKIVLPKDYQKFLNYSNTAPENRRPDANWTYGDPNQYDHYGMWDALGKPENFEEALRMNPDWQPDLYDGTYHGFSVNPNTGVWLKPFTPGEHKPGSTAWMEYAATQLNPELARNYRVIYDTDLGRMKGIRKEAYGGYLDKYQTAGQLRAATTSTAKEQNTKESMSDNRRAYEQALADQIAQKELDNAKSYLHTAGLLYRPFRLAESVLDAATGNYKDALLNLVPANIEGMSKLFQRRGGALPNKRQTNKNIKSSINYLMRRNETLFGPPGRNFYNPSAMSKRKKGGIAFPQQPTAETFYQQGWIPPGPVGFYEHGGIAFPQQPTEDYFFSGAPWMPHYGIGGGLPGGANEYSMPCMECGGSYADGGMYYGENGIGVNPTPVPAMDPDEYEANVLAPKDLAYTQNLIDRYKKQQQYIKEHPWTSTGRTTPGGAGTFIKTGQSGTPQEYIYEGGKYTPLTSNAIAANNTPFQNTPVQRTGGLIQAQPGFQVPGLYEWAASQQDSIRNVNGFDPSKFKTPYSGSVEFSPKDKKIINYGDTGYGLAVNDAGQSFLTAITKDKRGNWIADKKRLNEFDSLNSGNVFKRGDKFTTNFMAKQEKGGFMSPENMEGYPIFAQGGNDYYEDGGYSMGLNQDQVTTGMADTFNTAVQGNYRNDMMKNVSRDVLNAYGMDVPQAANGYNMDYFNQYNQQNAANINAMQNMYNQLQNSQPNLINNLGDWGGYAANTGNWYTKWKTRKTGEGTLPEAKDGFTGRKIPGMPELNLPPSNMPQLNFRSSTAQPAANPDAWMSADAQAKKKAFYDAATAYNQKWDAYDQFVNRPNPYGYSINTQGRFAPGYQTMFDMFGNDDYRVGRMSRSMKNMLPYLAFNPQNTYLQEIEAKKRWFGPGARKVKMKFRTVFDPRTGQQVQVPAGETTTSKSEGQSKDQGKSQKQSTAGQSTKSPFGAGFPAVYGVEENPTPGKNSPFTLGMPVGPGAYNVPENPAYPYGTPPAGTTFIGDTAYAPANPLASYPNINNFNYDNFMQDMRNAERYNPMTTSQMGASGMKYKEGGIHELTEEEIQQIMAAGGSVTYID